MKFRLFILGLSTFLFSGAQKIQVNIEWGENLSVVDDNNKKISLPSFKNVQYNNDLVPSYAKRIKLNGNVAIEDFAMSNLTVSNLQLDENLKGNISSEFKVDVTLTTQKKQKYAIISIIPLRKNSFGEIEKLVSFDIEIFTNKLPGNLFNTKKDFTTGSVMKDGSGEWYKMGVIQDGVYKVDYNYLNDLGIDVQNLQSRDINIYGNGFGLLPIDNSSYRPDDLLKNSIKIFDGNDGIIDPGDYILFYGKDVTNWSHDGTYFKHSKSTYCDTSYYFINIDPNNTPKRINTQAQSSQSVTHISNTFDDYAVNDDDRSNVIKSGSEWFGDHYDIVLDYSYEFNFSNLVDDAVMFYEVGARNKLASSQFTLVDGTNGINEVITLAQTGSGSYTPRLILKGNEVNFTPASDIINLSVNYNKPSSTADGFMNYIGVNVRRTLNVAESQFDFRDINTVGANNVTQFQLTGTNNVSEIWEVTSPYNVSSINFVQGATTNLNINTDSLREFIAFSNIFLEPIPFYKVANQNLHGLSQPDMVIVTNSNFYSEALRLADFHRQEGLKIHLVNENEVYNEFSSGMRDVTAIRDFMRMFYERAADSTTLPKYLLLFGDGSYDNRHILANNTNFLPTFQSTSTNGIIATTSSYVSDDYFGLLDPSESMVWNNSMDIGVGRLVCKTEEEARSLVDKIVHYSTNSALEDGGHVCSTSQGISTLGAWRNQITLIGDDENFDQDCEIFYNQIKTNNNEFNVNKIYMDAYRQESTPGGERYPEAQEAVKQSIQNGALIVNYVGHGGEVGWAHERVLDVPTINGFTNKNNMPIFVTATCEFSRFDDPARTSGGELLSLNSSGGGIALLTTTRLVYSAPNKALNASFYDNAFLEPNGEARRLGDIIMDTKNATKSIFSGDNYRNFMLIGDPAMKIATPNYNVITDSVNGISINVIDTISALSSVTVKGHLENDIDGSLLSNFNGYVYPIVYDKASQLETLKNDPSSSINSFELRNKVIYKGKASVTNGQFSFSFIVPKDIALQYGSGRISYYAHNGIEDAHGVTENLVVGGNDTSALADNIGPTVQLFMNDESFVFGGVTNEDPYLFAKVFDDNGINTVGNGIGHDVTAILDANSQNPIILNDYYESDLDTYQSGTITYPFSDLAVGTHTLTLKVWDVYNNSSEAETEFVVAESSEVVLEHVLNYPNPFTTKTEFFFEHNQACNSLQVEIQIFTISGKLVKTIHKSLFDNCFRSEGIEWDGRDQFGDQLAKGVYVYQIKVTNAEGKKAEKIEKLVILK